MKPVKPKKMPKRLGTWLANGVTTGRCLLNGDDCRAILAALEYERQRADVAERCLADVPFQMRPDTAAREKYVAHFQREQTAAVVPPPKAKRTPDGIVRCMCGHAQRTHLDRTERCNAAFCRCEKFTYG